MRREWQSHKQTDCHTGAEKGGQGREEINTFKQKQKKSSHHKSSKEENIFKDGHFFPPSFLNHGRQRC